AIAFGDQELTFTQVDELSNRLAHALTELGGGHRRRVGLLVNNSLVSVPLDFACVKAGINRVALNSRLAATEHVTMLTDTGCELGVLGPDLPARANAQATAQPHVRFVGLETIFGDEPSRLERAEQASAALPEVEIDPEDVILTLFTSGTAGTLKAAQHTQASYAGVCRNVLLNLVPATGDDAMLHAASLIHASGVF